MPVLLGGGGSGQGEGNRIASGDFNGDGRPDIATADAYSTMYGLRGCVRMYLHNQTAAGFDSILYVGKYPKSFLGCSTILSGDVNGDGKTDLIMTSYDRGPSGPGVVYLYLGKEQPDTTADYAFAPQLLPDQAFGGRFGEPMRIADINGDGYDDLLMYAGWRNGDSSQKGWFVYLGNKAAKYGAPDKVITSSTDSCYFDTFYLADLNADGCADMIEWNGAFSSPRVIWGRKNLPESFSCDASIQNPGTDIFDGGTYTTQMGDMDGDGIKDFFVTWDCPWFPSSFASYFYRGGKNWNSKATAFFSFLEFEDHFRCQPFDIGDVTGDGLSDVAVVAGQTDSDPYYRWYGVRIYRGAKYLDGVTPMAVDETKPVLLRADVCPNPLTQSSEKLMLSMDVPSPGRLTTRLYDVFGRMLYEKEAEITSRGSYLESVTYPFPSPGIYFLQVQIAGHFLMKPVTVSK